MNDASEGEHKESGVYMTRLGDRPAFFYVDLGVADLAPIASHPLFVRLTIAMLEQDEDGFPTEYESQAMEDLSDQVFAVIDAEEDAGKIRFVGACTSDGAYQYFCYCRNAEGLQEGFKPLLDAHPDRGSALESLDDPQWEIYLDYIYPSPVEEVAMQTAQMIETLEARGDVSSIEREIDHWLSFASEGRREAFLAELDEGRFRVETFEETEVYFVRLTVRATTEPALIQEMALELFQLADQHEGEYEGWETTPQTADPS